MSAMVIKTQKGTKTTIQDQLSKLSKRRAMNKNCSTLTAQNNSSSKDLSFFNDHTVIATERRETKRRGMKASIHKCLPLSSLSQTKSSNINSNKWSDREINMDLNDTYDASEARYSGFLAHTIVPMIPPVTTMIFQTHKGVKTVQ
jgi:hypothetical protein